MKRMERSYTIKRKRETLTLAEEVGVKAASEQLKFAKGTIYDWRKQAAAPWSLEGHSTSKTLKGQGRKEIFPGASDV
ncbi:hypothetical protein PHMEG_0009557 [Phytophthora megakarya]|uniref:Transposase n=1 Tax=Phytophthora megakarya TaxID=4795 RepID=A0A225WFY7_9STRA|nr:hypothetical protein PHMEG_0009557 [Phytophthora megakarya]